MNRPSPDDLKEIIMAEQRAKIKELEKENKELKKYKDKDALDIIRWSEKLREENEELKEKLWELAKMYNEKNDECIELYDRLDKLKIYEMLMKPDEMTEPYWEWIPIWATKEEIVEYAKKIAKHIKEKWDDELIYEEWLYD